MAMAADTIFDLKAYAYRLLSTRVLGHMDEKIALEYNLNQALKELNGIKRELSKLNKMANSSLAFAPEYQEEDSEISYLIREIKRRVEGLPSEPVNYDFWDEVPT